MLPFRVEFKTGEPIYEQVVYAAKKALVSGRLRAGDRFPSVRQLSEELKINPNTAHKVVAAMMHEGLLESKPGIGTIVADYQPGTTSLKHEIIADDVERLVVEALKLSLSLEDLEGAVRKTWKRMSNPDEKFNKS